MEDKMMYIKFKSKFWPKKFLRKEDPKVIQIERTDNCALQKFIGNKWKIIEQDERSLLIDEIHLEEIVLITANGKNNSASCGSIELETLYSRDFIRLDALIMKNLFVNMEKIPNLWIKSTDEMPKIIIFPGTILAEENDNKYVLCIYFDGVTFEWDALDIKYGIYPEFLFAIKYI